MSADNKAIVRRYIEEAYNKNNPSVVEETYARDHIKHWVHHGSADETGYDAKKATASRFRKVFPDDLHVAVDTLIAEGDMVAVQWTFSPARTVESWRHRSGHFPPQGTTSSSKASPPSACLVARSLKSGPASTGWGFGSKWAGLSLRKSSRKLLGDRRLELRTMVLLPAVRRVAERPAVTLPTFCTSVCKCSAEIEASPRHQLVRSR